MNDVRRRAREEKQTAKMAATETATTSKEWREASRATRMMRTARRDHERPNKA